MLRKKIITINVSNVTQTSNWIFLQIICKINVTEAYIIIIPKTNFNWLPAKQWLDDLTAKVQKMYKYRKVFFSQEFTFYRPLIKTSYEN